MATLSASRVGVSYGAKQALSDVSLDFAPDQVTALIGASGSGKSTLLRALNRLTDTIASAGVQGTITLDGADIHAPAMDVAVLRARIGLVFQTPNPFPQSIFDNVAYGPRLHGLAANRTDLAATVERSLRRAGLWDEVKDRLAARSAALSTAQRQQLCIARAIAVDPDVLLLDDPCAALDPIATARIEELIQSLKGRCTVVIVTHNMQQAARVTQRTAFLHAGTLVEYGATSDIFTNPRDQRTADYITGRHG